MAKTSGALFSLSASGSIGDSITIASWRGRQYVRVKVKPSNPKSAAQTGVRSMFKFLSQQWSGLTQANKDSWNALADSDNFLAFNAYQRGNAKRWATFKAPSQAYPAAETGTQASVTTETLTGGTGELTLDLSSVTKNDGWGVLVFLNTTSGFTPARNNTTQVVAFDADNDVSVSIPNLTAATYYVVTRYFTEAGALGTANTELSAVVA